MESQGEFDRRMEILLGSETIWRDPEAAEFSKSTIERYYGPCTDWTRADLIIPCAKPVVEPPVQFVVRTPPTMIEDGGLGQPSWVISMELRLFLERLLPHRPANYIYRAAGFDLLGKVRHLTNRGLMTESKMDEFQERALTLTCNMWGSEDFPRYEYRLTPFAETDEFFPLNALLQDM